MRLVYNLLPWFERPFLCKLGRHDLKIIPADPRWPVCYRCGGEGVFPK